MSKQRKNKNDKTNKKITATFISIMILVVTFLCTMIGLNIYNSGKLGDYNDDYLVKYGNFLLQEDEVYYVYMYQEECVNCKATKTDIVAYQRSDMMTKNAPLYTYCIDPDLQKGKLQKVDNEGNGVDELIGATNADNVFITSVPCLILIRRNADGVNEVATYVKGTTAIQAQLKIIVNYEIKV